MKTLNKFVILILALVLITSCASPPPPPMPTSTPKPTLVPPTDTPEPTLTMRPTRRPTATKPPPTPTKEGFPLTLPIGDPVSSWHGIRIMPGALNGKEQGTDTYIFTIEATTEEIESFYSNELAKLGWTLLGTGKGENENGNVLIIFTGTKGLLTISILTVEREGSLKYVMISEV